MHVDEGILQAYADGELADEERGPVELHLRICLACRATMTELQALARDFSGAVDLLQPAVQGSIYAPADTRRPRRPGAVRRALPRAAVFLVGVAAAAAAATPGSPVRGWVERWSAPPAPTAQALPPEQAALPPPEVVPEAGVSVEPLDGAVRVALRGAADEVLVRAEVVEGPRAGVYAVGTAATARFRTSPGAIEVDDVKGGEVRVELPRAARSASVTVNGREYVRKEADQLRLFVPSADRSTSSISFRVKP
jgi:hypothetical protein